MARACERVAVGHGLPPDGVVVHGAYAGVLKFCYGSRRGPLKAVAVQGSESEWNLDGSQLAHCTIGSSAGGKGNLKSLLLSWVKELESEDCPATGTYKQCNISTSGVLAALEKNGWQL